TKNFMPKDTKTLCIKKGCASVLTQPRFFIPCMPIPYFLFSINKCKIGSCAFNFVPFRRSNNQSSEIIDDKRR
ncbi:hypothetical protein KFX42_04540, partial [Bacteroides thetaiotaomicron]